MPRLTPVQNSADPATRDLLAAVEKKMGTVPNLISTMAQSLPVAQAYLGFSEALSKGRLSADLRERIALAVGEANGCGYCVAAHSVLGKMAGIAEDEVLAARRGESPDAEEAAALRFARTLVERRGQATDDDLAAIRDAGFDEGEIAEIVANVALNLFTNYFNHVAQTEIDFPAAPDLAAA